MFFFSLALAIEEALVMSMTPHGVHNSASGSCLECGSYSIKLAFVPSKARVKLDENPLFGWSGQGNLHQTFVVALEVRTYKQPCQKKLDQNTSTD